MESRILYHGDNLNVMRTLESDSIDLIYADPPFNTKKVFYTDRKFLKKEEAFSDKWTETLSLNRTQIEIYESKDEYSRTTLVVIARHLRTLDSIYQSLGTIEKNQWRHIRNYLIFMAPRLVEMKRLLKETGSVYLHCDIRTSHYLKPIMDLIWGFKQFRNEIVWCYAPHGKIPKIGFPRKHDSILLYSMSKDSTYTPTFSEASEKTIGSFRKEDEDDPRKYRVMGGKKHYLDDHPGYPIPSHWTDINAFNSMAKSKERTGYPTQKPKALLERMIGASSNPGDIVLDPFCGSGTTLDVSEMFERSWIGIDASSVGIETSITRLKSRFSYLPNVHYDFIEHFIEEK